MKTTNEEKQLKEGDVATQALWLNSAVSKDPFHKSLLSYLHSSPLRGAKSFFVRAQSTQ